MILYILIDSHCASRKEFNRGGPRPWLVHMCRKLSSMSVDDAALPQPYSPIFFWWEGHVCGIAEGKRACPVTVVRLCKDLNWHCQ